MTVEKLIEKNGKTSGNGEKIKVRLSQQNIVAAAAELFARNGFGATSLEDIATSLGVTKGALYYHVKNKEEILRLIFLQVLNVSEEPLRRISQSQISPAEKLARAITHHTAVAADGSPQMTVFYREHVHLTGPFSREITTRKKAYERLFEQIIEEGIEAGVFKSNLDPKIVTFGILGMCNWLSQWYKPGGTYTQAQIGDFFSRIVEGGLLVQD